MEAVNPRTGERFANIESTSASKIPGIMEEARTGYSDWQSRTVAERLQYLRALRHMIVEELDTCIDIIAKDTGKPKTEAIISEILTTLDAIKYTEDHAEQILQTKKVKTSLLLMGKKSYIAYRPRGVVLVISPWNYPFFLSMVPVISALAAGNSVILKPSEVTPAVGELMAQLFEKAGFPEETVQVAQGAGEIGAALVEASPDYIFFTGSVRTGKAIQQEAAKRLIPTTLELGGKDPMIVFRDANLDRAVNGAVWGAMTNSGQMCMGTERIYVEQSIYEEFVKRLKEKTEALHQNDSEDSDLGSMTFPKQLKIVKDHVREAMGSGARMKTGQHPEQWPGGLRIRPMIITDTDSTMPINQEETFGPAVTVTPFETEEKAIRQANDSSYGLSASVWTRDLLKAKRVAALLESGSVCINEVVSFVANPHLPFGGVKNSGIGRYHGETGLRSFCHEQSILIDSGSKRSEINWFPYKGKLKPLRQLIKSRFGEKTNWPKFLKAYRELLGKTKNGGTGK